MKKVILIAALALFAVSADEPSAFNAGNLEAKNPYGLSSTEKAIVKNRDNITELQKQIFKLRGEIDEMKTSFEGFKSVAEGEVSKGGDTRGRIDAIEKKVEVVGENLEKFMKAQDKNFEKINGVLKQLSKMIDGINSDYVSRKDMKSVMGGETPPKKETQKKSELALEKTSSDKSPSDIYKDAESAYFAKNLADAKNGFEESIKKNYKPATANYYLGEIAFKEKRHKDAIYFYKTSAGLYDKASYMPNLLYHTALSFEATGDKTNATKFFQSVVDTFPDSKEAKLATEKIK